MMSCVSLRTLVVAIGLTLLLPSSLPVKASALGRNGDIYPQDNKENPGNQDVNRNLGANNNNDLNNRAAVANQGRSENNREDTVVRGKSPSQLKLFQGKQNEGPLLARNSEQLQAANGGVAGARPVEGMGAAGAGVAPGGQFNDREKQNIGLGPPPLGMGKAAGVPQDGDLQTLDGKPANAVPFALGILLPDEIMKENFLLMIVFDTCLVIAGSLCRIYCSM